MNKIFKSSQKNLFWNYTEHDARDICRHQIYAMEHWVRRLIDERFKKVYGCDYFNYKKDDENFLIKKELRKRLINRIKKNPGDYPRKIDATTVEDLEYLLCREDLYNGHFKKIFEPFYSGVEELRNVMKKISGIRNRLFHENPISQHEVEQCVCYTNDIIVVLKEHYRNEGKEKEYNVPTFVAVRDCLGNYVVRADSSVEWSIHSSHLNEDGSPTKEIQLRPGESYRLELEVDASFPEDFYEVEWTVNFGYFTGQRIKKGKGKIVEFTATNESVSCRPEIYVTLTTIRDWHRFGHVIHDDILTFCLGEVLPPVEDTFL